MQKTKACLNFLKLCKLKYYNWSLFHSIQPNFIAQAGDPTETGKGGESVFVHDPTKKNTNSKYFLRETKPKIKHKKVGLISMVDNGSQMHGSQFLITLAPNLDNLDMRCTVFGEIVDGIENIDKLNEAVCNDQHRPLKDIR